MSERRRSGRARRGWRARLGGDGRLRARAAARHTGTATWPPTSPWCLPSSGAKPRAGRRAGAERAAGCRPSSSSRTEIAGPGFINFWLADDELVGTAPRASSPRARDYGRSDRGRGAQGQRRVRLRQSHRPAARRPRPRRRAGRRDRRAARVDRPRGHPRVLRQRRRRADRPAGAEPLGPGAAGGGPRAPRFPRAATTASTCRRTPALVLAREGRALRRPARRRRGCSACRALALRDPARGAGPRPRRLRRPLRRDDLGAVVYDRRRGVRRARPRCTSAGLTYEKDGALWLRTSDFGDDKDRVLRKQDGSYTYLAARHRLSHRQARARLRSRHRRLGRRPPRLHPADARGAPGARLSRDEFFDVALVQLVKVVRGGEEVKMSKRAGDFVTLRDLFDEVGVDAARYFFLMRQRRLARSTSTSTWPSGRPTRTRSSTCRWRTPG